MSNNDTTPSWTSLTPQHPLKRPRPPPPPPPPRPRPRPRPRQLRWTLVLGLVVLLIASLLSGSRKMQQWTIIIHHQSFSSSSSLSSTAMFHDHHDHHDHRHPRNVTLGRPALKAASIRSVGSSSSTTSTTTTTTTSSDQKIQEISTWPIITVIDPTSLRRYRNSQAPSSSSSTSTTAAAAEDYWKRLSAITTTTTTTTMNNHVVTKDSTCSVGPGQGIEEDAGYKLLVEQLVAHRLSSTSAGAGTPPPPPPPPTLTTTNTTTTTTNTPTTTTTDTTTTTTTSPIRLFCAIYTYSAQRQLAQFQAASWGHQCDGFVAFSNETLADWGIYALEHDGPEAYGNLWQKLRSLWNIMYQEFGTDFDYFHIGGDDMYVLVDHLRAFLETARTRSTRSTRSTRTMDANTNDDHPQFFGQWLPARSMLAGGPGYTLNAAALRAWVTEGLPNCHATTTAPYEDRLLSQCLQRHLGIWGNATDTRHYQTGSQRYHDAAPAMLYSFRANSATRGTSYLARMAASWEDQRHPSSTDDTTNGSSSSSSSSSSSLAVVGPRHGLDAVAVDSIAFHHIATPAFVARLYAILNPQTCPPTSPLGRGLLQHLNFLV